MKEEEVPNSPGLFLFDIDGTLMRGATDVHRDAFRHAYQEIYGLDLSLDGIPPAGHTDTWLFAEPLRRLGLSDAEIWARMPESFALMESFAEENQGDIRQFVLPGVASLLSGLRDREYMLGLLTGNLRGIALAKLRHAGLGDYFETGGFGEESEVRAQLVPVALANCGNISPKRVVVVGDTPMDIEAGRSHGTHTAVVATGPYTRQQLEECNPDLVLDSFENAAVAIESLVGVIRPQRAADTFRSSEDAIR